jgi:hypothetical protein
VTLWQWKQWKTLNSLKPVPWNCILEVTFLLKKKKKCIILFWILPSWESGDKLLVSWLDNGQKKLVLYQKRRCSSILIVLFFMNLMFLLSEDDFKIALAKNCCLLGKICIITMITSCHNPGRALVSQTEQILLRLIVWYINYIPGQCQLWSDQSPFFTHNFSPCSLNPGPWS